MYELIEEASKVLRTPPPVFDFENPKEDPKEIEKNMAEHGNIWWYWTVCKSGRSTI